MIEVVGERLPRDDRDDLGNLTIAVTGPSNSVEVFVAHPTAVLYELSSEMKRGVNDALRIHDISWPCDCPWIYLNRLFIGIYATFVSLVRAVLFSNP